MISKLTRSSLFIILPILLAACGEDPELVKKHGEQEAELAKLRGELALVEERLKYLPKDESAELNLALEKTARLEAEMKQLETEVAALEAEKKKLEEEYDSYQRKYVVR